MNDPKELAKLLRVIASGENAKAAKQDVIFNAAADLLDAPDQKPVAWQWFFEAAGEWLTIANPLPGRLENIRAQGHQLRPLFAKTPAPMTPKDFVEQMQGVRRMLWLIVKTAGAPGGVTIDREDIEAFDPLRAELISSTDARGNIHVEAKTGWKED